MLAYNRNWPFNSFLFSLLSISMGMNKKLYVYILTIHRYTVYVSIHCQTNVQTGLNATNKYGEKGEWKKKNESRHAHSTIRMLIHYKIKSNRIRKDHDWCVSAPMCIVKNVQHIECIYIYFVCMALFRFFLIFCFVCRFIFFTFLLISSFYIFLLIPYSLFNMYCVCI